MNSKRPAAIGLAIGFIAIIACTPVQAEVVQPIAGFPKLSAKFDWPWWRGPTRNGYADVDSAPPTVWSDSQNVVWKAPVPGRGHSSPTVIGDRVFLSTADEEKQVQSVLGFDRGTGKQLWEVDISQGGFPKTHSHNTHATPTIAGDGELLFVTFHHHDTLQLVALDRDGKIAWNQSLGEYHPRRYEYGYAPSPVLYRETVIISAEFDGDSFITAVNRKNGQRVWRIARPENITFSTPSIHPIGGRDLMTISGGDHVTCYDPATGRELWTVEATTAATCGTIVWDDDIIFASGGYPKAETAAIRVTERGKVLWKNQQKCYEESMLAYQGYLYAFTGKGVLYCFRAADGKQMWQKRLRGSVSASPVLAGGHIYWANERGTMYVFEPDPRECKMIAENVLGDESFASPAVGGNQLFLRVANGSGDSRQEFLYCIGAG